MALNLGRSRSDNPGSQNTILNTIKPGKVAMPKFTGKNASELNALAQFIEDKFNSGHLYDKDLTSSNVDTTLERLHTTFLKLKDASDADNQTAYDQLKSDIIDQVRSFVSDTRTEKPKETVWSEEDKEYLKDLIAASTLTEATEKTTDQTGQNGLTKDDINAALDTTIQKQQTLNNDVVAAAEEANQIVEDDSGADAVKADLQKMFNENRSDDSAIDDLKNNNNTQFQKIQELVSSQLGRLNAHINIIGENFKNSPVFNFKNPFTGAVGKIPSVMESLGGAFESLNDKIQAGIEKAKFPITAVQDAVGKVKDNLSEKISSLSTNFSKINANIDNFKKNISKKFDKTKTNIKNAALAPVKKIGEGLGNLKNSITSPLKKFQENLKKKKKKKKGGMIAGLMANIPLIGKFFNPPESSKEKKEKKKKSKLFGGVEKFMKKIGEVFKNIAKIVLDVLGTIILGVCSLIAKGIGIILRAIFLSPWGLIILASLLLISIGILLISLAVKKLVDYIVDDLGPIIKEKLKMINPETLNRFIEKVTKFIDVFTSILAGAFAPIIAIGTIIKNIIEPIGKLIKKIAEVLVKVLMPVIEFIGEILRIILVPIMKIIKIIVLAIAKILEALMPIIQMIVDIIVGVVKQILVPILQLIAAIIIPIVKIIGELVKGIIAIVQPIFDFIIAIITPIVKVIGEVVKALMELLKPIFDAVIGVIMVIVKAIKFVIDGVKWVFDKIMAGWRAFKDKLANVKIWKWHPFGFLKNKDDTKEDVKVDDGKAQQVINELNAKLKELQGNYDKAQEQIKILQEKLKEASSVKISKMTIINLLKSARLSALTLVKSVLPKLKTIMSRLKTIFSYMKKQFSQIKKRLSKLKLGRLRTAATKGKIKKIEQKTIIKKAPAKKLGFFDRIKAGIANKVKSAANIANKVAGKIPGPIKSVMKATPFGFLGSAAKGILNFAVAKTSNAVNAEKPKISIAPESIKNQFSSIEGINNKNKENMNNMSEDLEDMNEENSEESNVPDDITNTELKLFLTKMFENVDQSFFRINKKLDNPQVLPMPTPMNINNQALIGAN